MSGMNGRTCVVTGATSGIGFALSRLLAEAGARVIGVGRDPGRCSEAAERLRALTGSSRVELETADLACPDQIRALARRIASTVDAVDVLVNNAGLFALSRMESRDGVELQLAVNYLSAFHLTGLLFPCLAQDARIINTSSGSHYAGDMRWEDPQMLRRYNCLAAYDRSKLALVLFTRELARRLGPASGVGVYAVDPGLVRTDIGRKGTGPVAGLIWRLRSANGITADESAGSIQFLASDPDVGARTGLYWKDRRPVIPSRRAMDEDEALKLWSLSEKLCGMRFPAGEPCGEGAESITTAIDLVIHHE